MKIRKYSSTDKAKVIALFRLNTPEFFHPSEEEELVSYLENEMEEYFVVEKKDAIIGAGGVNYFRDENTARIAWDFIAPNQQGKGVGKKLTEYKINHIYKNFKADFIVVRTSQLAYKFYEKLGFKTENIEKDFWAKGFDLHEMRLENKS